jgi:Tol biopolymer transport system component
MPAAGGPAKVVYTFTGKWADAGTNGDTPTWAPDSRHLAFLGLSVGWVILDRLSRQHGVLLQGAGDVAFSPSSQKIVYSMRDREGFDLYERSVLGGTPVRLTHDGKSGSPAWGKLGIAFTREYVGPGGHLHGGIWLRDARTHRIRQLYTGASTYPAFFSANGNELLARSVYPAALGCCERLWAIDVATGVKRPLTPRWSDVSPLGMSADGSTVLAGIGCNGPKRSGYTETIPFAGGKPHVILRGPRDRGPCQASWNR